jgi:hypothetical protein
MDWMMFPSFATSQDIIKFLWMRRFRAMQPYPIWLIAFTKRQRNQLIQPSSQRAKVRG